MTPAPEIVAAARKAQEAWGVPASVSLAQYGLESAWGAKLAGKNNPFGIKALPGQPHTDAATHEVVHGQFVAAKLAFADFPSIEAAFDAHAKLLATAPVYAPAKAAPEKAAAASGKLSLSLAR